MIQIREIKDDEIERIREIQRKEEIRGYYKLVDGFLKIIDNYEYVYAFDNDELSDIIKRQRKLKREGGVILGAFDEEKLVGIVSVENKLRGIERNYCKMDILYVNFDCRGFGIGTKLVEESKKAAIKFGAAKLYISATPTINTIDFYLRQGAILTEELDLELFQREPDDIHLELRADS